MRVSDVLADGNGVSQITDRSFYIDLIERFRRAQWADTVTKGVRKQPMGTDGAVLSMEFVRLRADGSPLRPEDLPFSTGCIYFLRRRESGWKLAGLAEHRFG